MTRNHEVVGSIPVAGSIEKEKERFEEWAYLVGLRVKDSPHYRSAMAAWMERAKLGPVSSEEKHEMVLADTSYGMVGGDLYVCRACTSRVVVRGYESKPKCPTGK